MRSRAVGPLLLLCSLVLLACTSEPRSSAPEPGEVYAHAITRLRAQAGTPDASAPVFVVARGEGTTIDLDVQADILRRLQDTVDVRFVDEPSEAMDDDGVRDGGIITAVGPIVADGDRATLECDLRLSASSATTWRFSFRETADGWVPDRMEPLTSG